MGLGKGQWLAWDLLNGAGFPRCQLGQQGTGGLARKNTHSNGIDSSASLDLRQALAFPTAFH